MRKLILVTMMLIGTIVYGEDYTKDSNYIITKLNGRVKDDKFYFTTPLKKDGERYSAILYSDKLRKNGIKSGIVFMIRKSDEYREKDLISYLENENNGKNQLDMVINKYRRLIEIGLKENRLERVGKDIFGDGIIVTRTISGINVNIFVDNVYKVKIEDYLKKTKELKKTLVEKYGEKSGTLITVYIYNKADLIYKTLDLMVDFSLTSRLRELQKKIKANGERINNLTEEELKYILNYANLESIYSTHIEQCIIYCGKKYGEKDELEWYFDNEGYTLKGER